jgi:hypothetical protein
VTCCLTAKLTGDSTPSAWATIARPLGLGGDLPRPPIHASVADPRSPRGQDFSCASYTFAERGLLSRPEAAMAVSSLLPGARTDCNGDFRLPLTPSRRTDQRAQTFAR